MSEIPEPGDEDGTDPSIELPGRRRDASFAEANTLPPTPLPSSIGGAPMRAPRPPPLPSAALPRSGKPPARLGRTEHPPPPIGHRPPSVRPPSVRPPSVRPGSLPPAYMPRPSEPPMPRGDLQPPQRQRFLSMESELNETRSSVAHQRREIDELKSALAAKGTQLDSVLAGLPASGEQAAITDRLEQIDRGRRTLADRVHQRFAEADLARADDNQHRAELGRRLAALEEGSEHARIRMRLEHMSHRLGKIEEQLEALDPTRTIARLTRIESLFEELANEVREDRERVGLDALTTRLGIVEDLVLHAGTNEQTLRKAVEHQTARIEKLETLAPPPMSGDDLTRIKGVGPKYARRLADLGYVTFAALAAWSEDDVERIAMQLGVQAKRIRNAGWVEEAARLAAKSGD